MNSTFTWWFFNLGVSFIWLAVAFKTGNWFLAAGSVIYLGIAFLVDLPSTSSEDRGEWGEEDDDESVLS